MSASVRKIMVSSPPKHSGLAGTAVAAGQNIAYKRATNFDQEAHIVLSDSDDTAAPTVAGRHAKAVDAREKDLARFRTILSGQNHVHEQATTSSLLMGNEVSREYDGFPGIVNRESVESKHPSPAGSCVFPHPTLTFSKDPRILLPDASTQGVFSVEKHLFPRADIIEGHLNLVAPDAFTQGLLQEPPAGNGVCGPSWHPNAHMPSVEDAGLPRKRQKISNSADLAEHGDSFIGRQQIVNETAIPRQGFARFSSAQRDGVSLPTEGLNSKSPVMDASSYTAGRNTGTKAQETGLFKGIVHLIMANSRRRYNQFEGELSSHCTRLL